MYMSNKPPAPGPVASGYADVDAADAASAEPASSCRPDEQDDRSPPPGPTFHIHGPSSSSSSSDPLSSESSPRLRRTSFPISFPPFLFQRSKTPSASLAPSTAEGKPVPLTDAADVHRASALQKLNGKYPSALRRHGYTPEAPCAQSGTYSQPVLVRTYSGPSPSQGSRSARGRQYRPPSSSRGASRRVPLPSGDLSQPIRPTVSGVGVSTTSKISTDLDRSSTETNDGSSQGVSMPRPYKPKKASTSNTSKLPLPWPWGSASSPQEAEELKLPPLEAFSFKSFMADLQARGGDNDIGADLDRIAEICARSRYSLSNQYEVHVAPHGSGSSFISGVGPSPSSAPRRKGHSHSRSRSHGHGAGGPTLQAIPSDDENSARSNPRRRTGGGRRKSAAYGTLETIMSSSRSSEEDKSKKKSAAVLVGEVRGRAARKAWDNPSGSASGSASASTGNGGDGSADATTSTQPGQQASESAAAANKPARKKSASFASAVMGSSRSSSDKKTGGSSSSSRQKQPATATLRSEPARPQTSTSHLGVRTTSSTQGTATTTTSTTAPGAFGLASHGRRSDGRTAVEVHPTNTLAAAGLPSVQPASAPTAAAAAGDGGTAVGGGVLLSSWSASWIPWRSAPGPGAGQDAAGGAGPTQNQSHSHAEGSLRLLLRGAVGEGQGGEDRARTG